MYRSGDIIGPYTLVSQIGKGSFAVVWLAERRGSIVTTKVALKLPKEDYIDLDAIKQEASVWMEASGHPNVLPIIEADLYKGQVVIVSEYAPDGSLKDWTARFGGKAPPIENVLEIMLGIVSGLKHLHARHIIHRDLKPDNVLLQGETPRLVDFGLSRVLKASAQSDFIRGTPSYLSPEAISGQSCEQMDIWSAGVIFYHLIAGYLPFRRDDINALMWAIANEAPASLPQSIPDSLRETILRTLQKNPSLRYTSADEMLAAIRKLSRTFQMEPSIDAVGRSDQSIVIDDEPTIIRANQKIEIPLHTRKPSTEKEAKSWLTALGNGLRVVMQDFAKGSSRLRAGWATHTAQRQELAAQREAERAQERKLKDEQRKQREREERIRLEELRRLQAEERKQRVEEARQAAEQKPVIVQSASEKPSPDVSLHRQRAAALLRAREARQEQARTGQVQAADPALDPEVAAMISTASIIRTEPSEKTDKAKEPVPRRKMPIETPPGAFYKLPPLELLETPIGHHEEAEEELRERATLLAEKCKELGVIGHIHKINPGPVVTTFEFKPDPGIKYSRVVGLAEDLCLALKAESIRIDRIPGKSTVGIEVPNGLREKIYLRAIVESSKFQRSESKLTIALGKTINGEEYLTDLSKMPHLLIAGATGAGKSVTLNAIICSVLYKASPEDVKFIMIDPRRIELGLYEGIPHLLTPIVTDPKRAANALKWAVNEMENRYRQLAELGVRNIEQYNRQVQEMTLPNVTEDNPEARKSLPYIIIVIDELADLMMVARVDVESSIVRLAQTGHSVGVHLVLVTQRPSSDVLTGTIKANIPSRIALRMLSKVDSHTIIDSTGAEGLRHDGDMLFLPPDAAQFIRVHGSFVNEVEVKRIADHTRQQAEPDYNEQVTLSEVETGSMEGFDEQADDLFSEALEIVTDMGRASTSVLQRRLSIGYGRAAKILDMMERRGFIGPAEGSRPRKVLQAAYDFRERNQEIIREDLN